MKEPKLWPEKWIPTDDGPAHDVLKSLLVLAEKLSQNRTIYLIHLT
jgi:hypothetical protein